MTTWLMTHKPHCLCWAFIDTGYTQLTSTPGATTTNQAQPRHGLNGCCDRAVAMKNGSNRPSEWSFLAVVRYLPSSRLMLWLGIVGPLGIAHRDRVNESHRSFHQTGPATDGPLYETDNWCVEMSPKPFIMFYCIGPVDNQRRTPAKPKESAEAASANAIFYHNI